MAEPLHRSHRTWTGLVWLLQISRRSNPRRMSCDELPAPFTPNKNIRKATLARHGLALYESFGGDAAGDDGSLVIQPDIHIVHVVGCQLYVRIRRLLQAFQILLLVRETATGVGEDKFFSLDSIKEGIVVIDVRLANVPLQLHQVELSLRFFLVCLAESNRDRRQDYQHNSECSFHFAGPFRECRCLQFSEPE